VPRQPRYPADGEPPPQPAPRMPGTTSGAHPQREAVERAAIGLTRPRRRSPRPPPGRSRSRVAARPAPSAAPCTGFPSPPTKSTSVGAPGRPGEAPTRREWVCGQIPRRGNRQCPSMRTIGGAVKDGRSGRCAGCMCRPATVRWRLGCCTLVLHESDDVQVRGQRVLRLQHSHVAHRRSCRLNVKDGSTAREAVESVDVAG
jgi:hypothetical protein